MSEFRAELCSSPGILTSGMAILRKSLLALVFQAWTELLRAAGASLCPGCCCSPVGKGTMLDV